MKIQIEIPNATILDILRRANFAYWGKYGDNVTAASIGRMVKGDRPAVAIIEVDENTGKKTEHALTRASIENAIGIMAKTYPHKLAEILEEDQADMFTGDFLIQCALFGGEKYA